MPDTQAFEGENRRNRSAHQNDMPHKYVRQDPADAGKRVQQSFTGMKGTRTRPVQPPHADSADQRGEQSQGDHRLGQPALQFTQWYQRLDVAFSGA
ncbi:hypothetical protein D3C79_595610 [compost metagenome]